MTDDTTTTTEDTGVRVDLDMTPGSERLVIDGVDLDPSHVGLHDASFERDVDDTPIVIFTFTVVATAGSLTPQTGQGVTWGPSDD